MYIFFVRLRDTDHLCRSILRMVYLNNLTDVALRYFRFFVELSSCGLMTGAYCSNLEFCCLAFSIWDIRSLSELVDLTEFVS